MTRLLETVYFGHLDRATFVIVLSSVAAAFAVVLSAIVLGSADAEPSALMAALARSSSVLDIPGILLAHGLSEHRTAAILTLMGLFLITAVFALAARARDVGLWGWPTAFAALPVFVFAAHAEPWVASLALALFLFFALWPSRNAL